MLNLLKLDKQRKANKYKGRHYYYYKPSNQSTIDTVDIHGNISTIDLSGKTELYTNFFKMLVNQKKDYILANDPTINGFDDIVDVTSMLDDIVFNAALDGRAWVQLIIIDGILTYAAIPDREIIPIYDKYNKTLEKLYRYYNISDKVVKVEEWTKDGVNYYTIENDKITTQLESSHYKTISAYNDGRIDTIIDNNFGFIPFVELNNKRDLEDDSESIDCLLYMYNVISSGLIDNIFKFQEALIKLMGFAGDSESVREVMENLKKHKAAGIPEGSDINYMSIEIPIEGRKLVLQLLKENIFKIGQGLDPDLLVTGQLTNVNILARYAQLDMKANGLEKQLKIFFKKYCTCLEKYYNTKIDSTIVFNKAMLFNESEIIDNCIKSLALAEKGVISYETITKKHPWVKDYLNELKLIASQKALNDDSEQENDNKVIVPIDN